MVTERQLFGKTKQMKEGSRRAGLTGRRIALHYVLLHFWHWKLLEVPRSLQLMFWQGLQTPGVLPDRHWLVLQATLETSSHVYRLDVPLQLPARR